LYAFDTKLLFSKIDKVQKIVPHYSEIMAW